MLPQAHGQLMEPCQCKPETWYAMTRHHETREPTPTPLHPPLRGRQAVVRTRYGIFHPHETEALELRTQGLTGVLGTAP